MKVRLTSDLVVVAYRNFCTLAEIEYVGSGRQFWDFVGVEDPKTISGDWQVDEAVAHHVTMLAGPHYEAIFNVMKVKGYNYGKA